MIFLLVIYTLSLTVVKAEDIVDPSTAADQYRSLSNIIGSCLTTLFLCTWVSLHPNVPKPVNDSKLNNRQWWAHKIYALLKDQLLPFVLLLLVPEWILMWALRQRLVVEYMVRKRKDLTRTHGFFIIMGGFHKFTKFKISTRVPSDSLPVSSDPSMESDLEKNTIDKKDDDVYGEPDHLLGRLDVYRLLDDGKLQLPPKIEIDDKSKSDWIAKSLVLLQTLWFVTQCIARKVGHLPLAELEVVTLGYILLNLVIYVIWWDKPQKVSTPIRVFCGEFPHRNDKQRQFEQEMKKSYWMKLFSLLFGLQDDYVNLWSIEKTPTFYSGNPPNDWPIKSMPLEFVALMVTTVIGGLVGAIHFLAWSSSFPTHKMHILWRWGSTLMTAAPFPTFAYCIAGLFSESLHNVGNNFAMIIRNWVARPLFILSGILSMSLVPLAYVVGRVITLTIAFQTLSSLSSEAFQSIQWTNIFPHI
ncbi:hypothetical protein FRB91_005157 [Serendipita sp. 411]|nr:hypothetical protein FRC19_004978 [Serendipita sp. 401]KAG8841303.1 hypothetical protein FRB91_005157 [Serendipita sp. 411]